jgi:hypothetical protein
LLLKIYGDVFPDIDRIGFASLAPNKSIFVPSAYPAEMRDKEV